MILMMNKKEIIGWIETKDYLNELKNYIAHPSRSNQEAEVKKCSKFAKKLMIKAGLSVDIIETSGNPVLFGFHLNKETDPTLLLYGHYDVQPEGDLIKWDTNPFEATLRGNKLFGRGTADNKGQHYAHLLAIRYIKENFPDIFNSVNIKFILDGDEERGSFSLPEFFEKYKTKLSSDIAIVSDGPSLVYDKPTIVGSVRGILTFQIIITHNQEDLHSGNFGGLGRSATQDLTQLLSDMLAVDGRCKIPGFYEKVVSPTEFETNLLEKLTPVFTDIDVKKDLTEATLQENRNRIEQNQIWPTFNINGLSAGGVGDNRRTIIPSQAIASIDCRLVPNQRSETIKELIEDFIKKWAQSNNIANSISIEFEHAMEPVKSSLNNEELGIIAEAMKLGFGTEPILVPRLGGSLPLYLFPEYLNKDVFLIPYALPDENNHAPNENLDLPYFKSGVVASVHLIDLTSKMNKP